MPLFQSESKCETILMKMTLICMKMKLHEFCMQFHFRANQSHFHKNGFALRLALKQRHKRTRKWPIPITKQNNTDEKLDFSTGRVFVQCDKSKNTKLSILIK